MRIPKTLAAAATVLTALVIAMVAVVAMPIAPPPSAMSWPAPAEPPGIPIDDPGALPTVPDLSECEPLTARNPDGNYIVPGVRGAIVYRRIGSGSGSGSGSGVTELSLDAYVQPGGGGPRPGVIVLHGGGWERGSRAAFTGQFLELLTRAGYNWVSIDYRLGPMSQHRRAIEDVEAALRFVRCHARTLKIDLERLVVWGEDTGAQLAALTLSRPATGVAAMVLVGGYYDLPEASLPPGAEPDMPPELLQEASPMHVVRQWMPSTLVVHGTADSETPLIHARRYCGELRTLSVPCDVIEVDGASHRAENWWPSQWGYKARVLDWLSRTLSFDARASGTSGRVAARVPGLHKDIVFSPALDLKLDAYIPPVQRGVTGVRGATGPFPAVIIAHGGGWEAGDKVTYVTPLFEPLAKAGFAWFSIDYRLTPDVLHPAQLDDLRDAIRFVRANATRFNIDPNRIALLGESASGQMVMQVAAVNATDTAVAAVVSFYGVYDFELMVEGDPSPPRSLLWRLFRLPTLHAPARAVLRAHSPIHHVRRGMPPVLLIHGTNERLWTQGQSMSRVLTDHGVPHELIALEGAPHGLENWEGHAPWMLYKTRLVTWLRENLRPNVPER
jgi:acetyl esterase